MRSEVVGTLTESVPGSGTGASASPEPEALRAPTQRVGWGFAAALGVAMFANGMLWNPTQSYLIPTQVAALDPHSKVLGLGLIGAIGTLVSIVPTALAGALSDRTASRFGRRRSWILVGTLLSALALAWMATAGTIVALLLSYCLLQVVGSAAYAALMAVLPDRVPVGQRGVVSGLVNLTVPVSLLAGIVVVVLLVQDVQRAYAVLIAVVLLGTIPFVLRREPALPREAVPPVRLGEFVGSFVQPFRQSRDYVLANLSRFFMYLAILSPLSYLLYWLTDGLHYRAQAATELFGVLALMVAATAAITSLVGGWLSDRGGQRKPFVIGAGLIVAVGLAGLSLSADGGRMLVWAGVVGVGYGTYFGVDLALLTQVLPSRQDHGKDLGIAYLPYAVPQVVAYVVAVVIVGLFHSYLVLFLFAAGAALLGAGLVQLIRGVR